MAFLAKTQINTYPVEAYRVVETVVFTKPSGCGGKGHLGVHSNDLPAKDLADTQGTRFGPLATVIGPDPTKTPPVATTQPDGSTLLTPTPGLPAYGDLVAAPLGSWAELPENVTTLDDLLAQVSLHDLVFQLAYRVARLAPESRDAIDA